MHVVNFSAEAAIDFGLEEAILLWEICVKFRKAKWLGENIYDGEVWLPLDPWQLKFALPFWSQAKITSVLKILINKGVILKERRYEIRREFSYHIAKEIYLE